MLTREQAGDIERFTKAVTVAFDIGPKHIPQEQREVYYALSVEIDNQLHGCCVNMGSKQFDVNEVGFIVQHWWQELVNDGIAGNASTMLTLASVTLTGNPMNDLIQVVGEMHVRDQLKH